MRGEAGTATEAIGRAPASSGSGETADGAPSLASSADYDVERAIALFRLAYDRAVAARARAAT
jgi:hypothetical protein